MSDQKKKGLIFEKARFDNFLKLSQNSKSKELRKSKSLSWFIKLLSHRENAPRSSGSTLMAGG